MVLCCFSAKEKPPSAPNAAPVSEKVAEPQAVKVLSAKPVQQLNPLVALKAEPMPQPESPIGLQDSPSSSAPLVPPWNQNILSNAYADNSTSKHLRSSSAADRDTEILKSNLGEVSFQAISVFSSKALLFLMPTRNSRFWRT
jgi:hypothetical protein